MLNPLCSVCREIDHRSATNRTLLLTPVLHHLPTILAAGLVTTVLEGHVGRFAHANTALLGLYILPPVVLASGIRLPFVSGSLVFIQVHLLSKHLSKCCKIIGATVVVLIFVLIHQALSKTAICLKLGIQDVVFVLHTTSVITISQDLSFSDLLSQSLLSSSLRLGLSLLLLVLNSSRHFSICLKLRLLRCTSHLLLVLIVLLIEQSSLLSLYLRANSERLICQLTNLLKHFVLHQILSILSVCHELDLVRLVSLLYEFSACQVVVDLGLLLLFIIVENGKRFVSMMPEVFHSLLIVQGSHTALGPCISLASVERCRLLLKFVSTLIPCRLELAG